MCGDMRRRNYLAALGIAALAGCTGDPNGDDTGTDDSDDTDPADNSDDSNGVDPADDSDDSDDSDPGTADDSDDTNGTAEPEAVFELVEIDIPEEVSSSEEWGWSLTVENTGDAAGTFETAVLAGEAGENLEHIGDISLDIDAGETGTYDSEPSQFPYVTRVEYYFDEFDASREVSVLTAVHSYGEVFRNPEGVEITVTDVDLRSAYTYEDWDGTTASEEASSGYQWAFVWVEVLNDSGSSEWIPWVSDFNILVNGSQYDYDFILKTEDEYEGGSEIADGVTRSGWIAYEIPEELSVDDLQIHHSDRDFFGEWEVRWQN